MLVGSVIVYSAFGAAPTAEEAAEAPPSPTAPRREKSSGFMDRMEDRWRRRSEDGQQ